MNTMSSISRANISGSLDGHTFDLLIIGGGITGAGIALDAASRGIKAILIEKNDFASGTSSRSTKLIHGGLRYLKNMEFGLVSEVGKERAIVHKNAPHLVVPEKMLLPLVKNGSLGPATTSMALWVYDYLANVKSDDKRSMLSSEEALALEPLLSKENVIAGGLYAEYRTDDARLTIEVIKTASRLGASCINYMEFKEFIYYKGFVVGAKCYDHIAQKEIMINAMRVVNAAGPWVDEIRRKNQADETLGKHLFITKGVHLVVPYEKFPVKQSIYFDVPDGRMLFAIPRGKTTYFGTTDTPFNGDKNNPLIDYSDADYLLNCVNTVFPDLDLTARDVVSSWAGLRPLIHEQGKPPSEVSRKDEIFSSPSGLISIAGGKLTGYRKMAERVTDKVARHLKHINRKKYPNCKTKNIRICGGDFNSLQEITEFTSNTAAKLREKNLMDSHRAKTLVANYGTQTDMIIKKMADFDKNEPDIALARAECWFTVHYESACTLQDFFIRRTGRLYFEIDCIEKLRPFILTDMRDYLSWDQQTCIQQEMELKTAVKQAVTFYK